MMKLIKPLCGNHIKKVFNYIAFFQKLEYSLHNVSVMTLFHLKVGHFL